MTISERIFERLKQLSMTQKEFAEELGTSQSRISDYETGKKLPPAELLIRLANDYQVSYDWLFTGAIESEKSFH